MNDKFEWINRESPARVMSFERYLILYKYTSRGSGTEIDPFMKGSRVGLRERKGETRMLVNMIL